MSAHTSRGHAGSLALLTWVLLSGAWLCPPLAHGQNVRDLVRDHLEHNLEPETPARPATQPVPAQQPAPPPPAPSAPPPAPPAPGAAPDSSYHWQMSSSDPEPAPDPSEPPLPRRVFGKYLKLDLTVGGGYRGWLPQQYKEVPVKVGTYYVWTVELKAKLFNAVNLHRGYFESNALSGPRTREAAVAAQVGSYIPKAAWLLGVLGFPLFRAWEPIIRYESRAFQTEARPKQPVCVVNDAVAGDLSLCPRSTDRLRMRSGFETLVAGVRYDRSKEPTAVIEAHHGGLPPITFGLGLMSYRKPYQVNVDGNTLNGYLFDGRFRGAGLMVGTDVAGGPDHFFAHIDAQVGLGEVRLTKKLTLNSLAPDDWFMGYVQGTATVGYYLPLFRRVPTLMFVPQATLGGASFFLFDTTTKQTQQKSASSVNYDLLWSAHAALVMSL